MRHDRPLPFLGHRTIRAVLDEIRRIRFKMVTPHIYHASLAVEADEVGAMHEADFDAIGIKQP